MTRGDVIINDNHNKKYEIQGRVFFCYGTLTGSDRLIDAYLNNNIQLPIEANALMVEKGKIYHLGFDPDSEPAHIWKTLIDRPEAFGSGEHFAFTAMDMGCTAREAVLMASKRDVYTNKNVNVYEVKYAQNL